MTGTRLDPDELAGLEEQRDFLLASIEDLEREHAAGDLDEHDYETLRDDYTARAAEVLRAIDARRAVADTARRPRRLGRLIASGVAVVALAVGAGVWVAQSSGTRNPGQTITGNAGPAAGGGGQAGSGAANGGQTSGGQRMGGPTGGGASASPASQCIPKITTATLDALKCFQKVLAKNPKDPMALTYKGWTLTLASQATDDPSQVHELSSAAEASLEQAVAADPKLPDPHAFLAILYANSGRCDQARAQLAELDKLHLPSDSMILQLVNGRLRPQLANDACPKPG